MITLVKRSLKEYNELKCPCHALEFNSGYKYEFLQDTELSVDEDLEEVCERFGISLKSEAMMASHEMPSDDEEETEDVEDEVTAWNFGFKVEDRVTTISRIMNGLALFKVTQYDWDKVHTEDMKTVMANLRLAIWRANSLEFLKENIGELNEVLLATAIYRQCYKQADWVWSIYDM